MTGDDSADLIERVLLLGRIEAFGALPSAQVALLARLSRRVDLAAGEVLFTAGSHPDAMYLVLDGDVVLEQRGQVLARAGQGQDLGTWALFDPEPRVADARAVAPSTLLAIDRQPFADALAEHPELAHGILRALARRVRTLSTMLTAASTEDHESTRA